MYTKSLERKKTLALRANSLDYNRKITIPNSVLPDLTWWINNLPHARNSFKTADFTVEIHSDASNTGWGATNGLVDSYGFWDNDQKKYHINYKELLAVKLALESLAGSLHDCQILLRVDNTTAIAYVNKMGVRYPLYNKLAKNIWQWAERRKIFLFASYIASADNKQADSLSRLINKDTEWKLNSKVFDTIKRHFGIPDIDLFACKENTKCKNFFSWKPDPEALQVDAFTVSWTGLKFYAFPPFSLILKALVKIRQDRATGVMVVPDWLGQPWYPLFKDACERSPYFWSRP